MPDPLTLEVARTSEALDALRPVWQDLHRRCPDATPFQSPEWLIPWWHALGEGTLCAWMAMCGDEMVALAPLYIWNSPRDARTLLLLGAGTSDYLDALCLPAHRASFGAALLEVLVGEGWDVCEFAQLRGGSPLLHGNLPARLRDTRMHDEPCPVLRLASDASLETCIPRRMRQNLRYYRRRAEQAGAVEIRQAPAHETAAFFDRLVALHGVRWSERGTAGVLAHDRVLAAHRAALPELASAGMLRLYELMIGARVAASLYAIADPRPHGRVYYYVGGFDPECRDVSPGTLLIAHAIADALAQGAEAFDFLRGCESYKYLWGARDEITWHRRMQRE